jgi:hypothetical protein
MNNVAAGTLAYDILEKLAGLMGYRGINPEFLSDLRDNHARKGFLDVPGDFAPSDVAAAYSRVMADIRALFAPA